MSDQEDLSGRSLVLKWSRKLWIALTIGIIWLAILGWLTLTYSNPVVLNRAQLLRADGVLQGRFAENGNDFIVEEFWKRQPGEEKLKFRNIRLVSPAPQPGLDYLVPVTISVDRIEVTKSPIRELPLIYPANAEVVAELENLLAQ